jgi:DNA polymerase V
MCPANGSFGLTCAAGRGDSFEQYGCAVALSREAKIWASPRTPYFKCRDTIKAYGGEVFSSNYALYGDMSGGSCVPLERSRLKSRSIPSTRLFCAWPSRNARECALCLKHSVERHTAFRCRWAQLPTKTLAKLANHTAKKTAEGVLCTRRTGTRRAAGPHRA